MDKEVSVTNTAGDVVLIGIVGDARVSLLTGNIESEVTLPLNGTIEMDTFIGDINLDIPVDTSADFSAMATDGSIDVVNLVLQDEVSSSDSVSGTLGSGEGLITLESEFGGDINVTGFYSYIVIAQLSPGLSISIVDIARLQLPAIPGADIAWRECWG
jgi:hypothetical protein